MITLRPRNERGHAQIGWLDTYHSFSFADYYDPEHMGFRSLRVINEDRVAPGMGFGTHPHNDMEILTLVLSGALQHKDSMGNGSIIRPGELQYMSAGTGITHSEFNPSRTEPLHLYQIWIRPDKDDYEPTYAQLTVKDEDKAGRFKLVASKDGRDDSLQIRQDADLYLATLEKGQAVRYAPKADRHVWLQVLRGNVSLARESRSALALTAGDAVAFTPAEALNITTSGLAELLLFDLG
jgi:quercetin 2,3-dioxygenase